MQRFQSKIGQVTDTLDNSHNQCAAAGMRWGQSNRTSSVSYLVGVDARTQEIVFPHAVTPRVKLFNG